MKPLSYKLLSLMTAVVLLATACQQEKLVVYEVNKEQVSLSTIDKNNYKKELEFITLAYSDLFDKPIDNAELQQTAFTYAAIGDKDLVTDMLIRDFLKRDNAPLPSDFEMRLNIPVFVENTYQKFYHRKPTEMEKWYWNDAIGKDADITPSLIYYTFLTSEEYRFF